MQKRPITFSLCRYVQQKRHVGTGRNCVFVCVTHLDIFIVVLILCARNNRGQCNTLQHTATHCITLQHTATHCNTLHHTATHCITMQHTATHCITQHYTTSHCNTLQHTASYSITLQHAATRCITLQLTASRCITLHHTASHYNTLHYTVSYSTQDKVVPNSRLSVLVSRIHRARYYTFTNTRTQTCIQKRNRKDVLEGYFS